MPAITQKARDARQDLVDTVEIAVDYARSQELAMTVTLGNLGIYTLLRGPVAPDVLQRSSRTILTLVERRRKAGDRLVTLTAGGGLNDARDVYLEPFEANIFEIRLHRLKNSEIQDSLFRLAVMHADFSLEASEAAAQQFLENPYIYGVHGTEFDDYARSIRPDYEG